MFRMEVGYYHLSRIKNQDHNAHDKKIINDYNDCVSNLKS